MHRKRTTIKITPTMRKMIDEAAANHRLLEDKDHPDRFGIEHDDIYMIVLALAHLNRYAKETATHMGLDTRADPPHTL